MCEVPDDHYANTEQICCLERGMLFLAYENFFRMALASMALCFSVLTVLISSGFLKHVDTSIVKVKNYSQLHHTHPSHALSSASYSSLKNPA